jgi:ABC-type sugar transport system ATPase subunit
MLHEGIPATLGIRPEHVRLSSEGPDGAGSVPGNGVSNGTSPPSAAIRLAGEIRLIEQMGAQTVLVCAIGPGQPLRVLCERLHDAKAGHPCLLSLQVDRIHLFSKDTGASLLRTNL